MESYYLKGFTIIELLVAIAIIGIITTIAIPSYQNYTRRAHYTELIQASAPFKLGIEECFQLTNNLNDCQPGKNGVPNNIDPDKGIGLTGSIIVKEGIITVTPRPLYGITSVDTYILTPVAKNNQLIWMHSGGGVNQGYVK